MPLYEYKCRKCSQIIEFRASMEKKVEMAESLRCDACGTNDFVQVFSGIAVTGESKSRSAAPPQPGSCCAGGMCNLQ